VSDSEAPAVPYHGSVLGLQGCIEDPARVPDLEADQETEVRENVRQDKKTDPTRAQACARLSERNVTFQAV